MPLTPGSPLPMPLRYGLAKRRVAGVHGGALGSGRVVKDGMNWPRPTAEPVTK